MNLKEGLLWCAGGVEIDLFDESPSERTRYISLGLAVCLPALIGFIGATAAIRTLGQHWAIAMVGGVLWAAVIFIIDRGLVVSFKRTAPVPSDEGAWVRIGNWFVATSRMVLLLSARLAIALFVGFILSHAMVLLVFRPEIEEALLEKQDQSGRQSVEELQEELRQTSSRRAGLYTTLEELRKERREQEVLLQNELGGEGITGKEGDGPVYHQILNTVRGLERDIEVASQDLRQREPLLSQRIERLEGLIESERQETETRTSFGYMARSRALEGLSAQSPQLNRDRLVLLGFFILIELLPVLLKSFVVYGPYALAVAVREWSTEESWRVDLESLQSVHTARVRARSLKHLAATGESL